MPSQPTATPIIRKDMPIADIVAFCPEAKDVLAEYGLHCFHCTGAAVENLEDGCRSHGYDDQEIEALVTDLNDMLDRLPPKPHTLIVTTAAARAIADVAASEGKAGEGLAVIVDGSGGFCMEFRADPQVDETTFNNEEVPEVRLFASAMTLKRIGGSTIDFRDGRFKLDLPSNDPANSSCGCGGSCDCK